MLWPAVCGGAVAAPGDGGSSGVTLFKWGSAAEHNWRARAEHNAHAKRAIFKRNKNPKFVNLDHKGILYSFFT